MDPQDNINAHFVSLVMMLASACWQQIGKIPNPMTGKIEKELEHAQLTIEILSMIKDKTKGNLSLEEDRLISNTLSDLQINYADEISKNEENKPVN
jgi:hypothetical protein